jgi:2',3'-cyclic-nucleotide 2'-phosphodiesterase (5'-nucleotidase family)
LLRGEPNPNGTEQTELFLLAGDPSAGPIREIVPAENLALPPRRADLAEQPFRLCLLHCNDLHGHISQITKHGDQPIFSRMVWRVRELRHRFRSDPNAAVLFLSAGDDLMGFILSELLGDGPESCVIHAAYHLYSAAGLDVGVLGNHELDMGLTLLAHALRRDACFPMLSANLAGCRQLDGVVYPGAILVVKGLRIGFVGLTTRGQVKRSSTVSLCMVDPLQVAQNLVPALRPLCDALIVLSHLGHSLIDCTATVLDVGDVELARSLPPGSVDLIVGAHTHKCLNENGLNSANVVNGVPIVQAGAEGHYLGQVDLTIEQRVTVTDARLAPISKLPLDDGFECQAVQPILAQARLLSARSLGQVTYHPDLTADAVRNGFASGESALANFITDAIVARCRMRGHMVSLAAIDGSCLYQGLPAGGKLAFGNWFDMMPYADTICLFQISAQHLRALLDDNARRADRPEEPHTERGFLQFSQQLRYTIVLGEERPGARATGIVLDGAPLREQWDRTLLIACTSFCREAALPWERCISQNSTMPLTGLPLDDCIETGLLVRDEMVSFIRLNGGVTRAAGLRRDGRLRISNRQEREK